MLSQLSISEIIIFFIAILISMVVHEACHGYVAYWLGDNTALEHGRLTFNPLKSIDLLTTILLPVVLVLFGLMPFFAAKPVPINPRNLKFGNYGSALVGLAGPVSNLLMAAVVGTILRLFGADFSSFLTTFSQSYLDPLGFDNFYTLYLEYSNLIKTASHNLSYPLVF